MKTYDKLPMQQANAILVLADGSFFKGRGIGAYGESVGELCFNTSITGYQEIMTDPSYAGQIITFTFPHIGNTGTNEEDIESVIPAALGCVLAQDITEPSNWRDQASFDRWLKNRHIAGICGVDTRALTRKMRDLGAQHVLLAHRPEGKFDDLANLVDQAKSWPGLTGKDLAIEVTCRQMYRWDQGDWRLGEGYRTQTKPSMKIVAIDYGIKRNILRNLAELGADVIVMPAQSRTEDILAHQPDGIFLSNGPGDPMATGQYAVPVIQDLIKHGLPIFGICLGHQMLALALGGQTKKMPIGHRGANHPVKNLLTGKVEITSQNHGFSVVKESLPAHVTETHISLFDQSLEGLEVKDRPIFSVQYHPEASPGPKDSHYLFKRFINDVERNKRSP